MCVEQPVQKLLLQPPVNQLVLCNASFVVVDKDSPRVRDPGSSVAGNCNIKRASVVVWLDVHRLIRIAAGEDIQAVIGIARDPDVPVCIGSHSLCPERPTLVTVRL